MRIAWIIGLLVLGWGCSPTPPPAAADACPTLDSLFAQTDALESALAGDEWQWPQLESQMESTLATMERNQHSGNMDCSYLNHRYHPEKERFLFVDQLTEAAITDTMPKILYYLVRLRSIFGDDPEIFEYLSEEMAHVGFANPSAYLQYLSLHPEQKSLILNSTMWNPVNASKLLAKFGSLPDGAPVVDFLRQRFPAVLSGS